MYDVPVFFVSTDGQTSRIAEAIAASLRAEGLTSGSIAIASEAADAFDWTGTRGVVLAAPIRIGKHPRSAAAFARRHAARLGALPTLLVSVSLSAASRHPEERLAAERIAQAFATGVGWTPTRIASVAGALAYTRYSFVTRWFMARIARKEGGPTDTRRDHELTDWRGLADVARGFAATVRAASNLHAHA